MHSSIPEARKRRQSSYLYTQGASNPLSSHWYDEPPRYSRGPPARGLPPDRQYSRHRSPFTEFGDAPPVRRRPRSLSSSPDRGRQRPRQSQTYRRRRHSLSGDEMEDVRKSRNREAKEKGSDEESLATKLRKQVQALESIIAADRKIAGRKDSNLVEPKTPQTIPGPKVEKDSIHPRFTWSPTRMDDELDSIIPQRGSTRGSVTLGNIRKDDRGRLKEPIRYQKPSVVSAVVSWFDKPY